jgi:hypothetical protein
MELIVTRQIFTEESTVGSLSIDGKFQCFTLEDVQREIEGEPVASWKIPGKTAIPKGKYEVVIDFSPHFGHDLPHILNVPGYTGVRIHPGNDDEDTEGCILVGLTRSPNFVGQSRNAFDNLSPLLDEAYAKCEKIMLEVK